MAKAKESATKRVVTKPFGDGSGRQVKVNEIDASSINTWLGDAGELQWFTPGKDKSVALPKLRVRTKLGIRVAHVGDTIVKFGTRRNGGTPTFLVFKRTV